MSTNSTKKRGLRFRFVAVLACAGVTQWAAAQDERLTVEVGRCVDLPTPEQRLACFESQVEAARTQGGSAAAPDVAAPPSSERSSAPAPANRAAAPSREERRAASSAPEPAEFGFREGRPEPEREAPPEVHAKIAELRETVPNAYLITLDNGQVWRQTRGDPYLTPRVGQDVRIFLSRWRTYRLDSPQMRGFLQVERVR